MKQAATHARNMRIAEEVAYLESEARSKGQATRWRHKRAQMGGIWLSAMPNRWNGTEIPAEQFFDNVRLRINKKPLFMPDKCDGCGARMDVEHALSCKVGGLVHIRHDDVANEWGHLSGLAFSPSCVSHEPRINMSETAAERQSAQENVTNPPQQETRRGRRPRRQQRNTDLGDVQTCEDEREDNTHAPYAVSTENRADKGVHGFWKRGRLCLFDVRITDTECRSTRNQDPEKVLQKCEQLKKEKHLAPCLERRRDFTPLVYSVDGMAGRETKAAERKLASRLASKWDREYSEMVGFVRMRMAIAVVRANSLLIRGSRERRTTRVRPAIDEGAAMDGWQHWRERY